MKVLTFEPRFVPARLLTELSSYWHLSATAVSGTYSGDGARRHKRRIWTANWFAKEHPELNLSPTAIYKDLDAMLTFDGILR